MRGLDGEHNNERIEVRVNPREKLPSFTFAYTSLLRCTALSVGARLLLIDLLAYQGNNESAFPSMKRLQSDLNTSKPTILKWRNELVRTGWLKVVNQRDDQGGSSSNLYICCRAEPDPDWIKEAMNNSIAQKSGKPAGDGGSSKNEPPQSKGGGKKSLPPKSPAEGVKNLYPGGVKKFDPNITKDVNKTNKPTNQSVSPPQEKDEEIKNGGLVGKYPSEFEELWKISPKQHSKEKAFIEWREVVAQGFDAAVVLAAFKKSVEKFSKDGYEKRYFPALNRWLSSDAKCSWHQQKSTAANNDDRSLLLRGISDNDLEAALAKTSAEAGELYQRARGVPVEEEDTDAIDVWCQYFARHKALAGEAYLQELQRVV